MSDKKSSEPKKKSKAAKSLLEVVIGIAIFIAIVIAFLVFLAMMWGPEGPNMDRTFKAFLPFLIVGACIAVAVTIGLKILKKRQKK